MTSLATLCALLLIAVFVWSALAKLRRPAPTAEAFGHLGVPFPSLAARLVPVAELALAALLATNAPFGSALSIIVLILFTLILLPAAVTFAHSTGHSDGHEGRADATTPAVISCGCFGSASTAPISWVEVVRNLFLITAAVVAALRGPVALSAAVADLSLPDLIAFSTAGLVAALTLQLVALKRDIGAVWHAGLAGESDDPAHTHAFQGGLHA